MRILSNLALAAAVTGSATAQFGLTSGIGDAFRPAFSTRDVQLAMEMLDLDEAQRFILETLFEDYQVEFKTGVDSFRDRIGDLRNQIDPDNPDPGQIMRVVFGNVDEWRAESQEIADRFTDDLEGLLNDEQLDAWPKFQRRLFRLKYLKNGQLSGENLDLINEVQMMGLSEPQMQALNLLLDEYESDLDDAIRRREAFLSDSQAQLIRAVQDEDPRVGLAVAAQQVELREGVRDVNARYTEAIAAAMPEEVSTDFLHTVRQKSYPRVYRPTQADRVFKAALNIAELSDDTRQAITDLYGQYQSELEAFNEQLVAMIRGHEPKKIKAKVEQAAARLSGSSPERLADPTREQYGKRREMADRYVEQLRAVLTPQQFNSLPGSRRWLSPDERARLGEDRVIPAGSGFNKLDRRRQSSLAPTDAPEKGGDNAPKRIGK